MQRHAVAAVALLALAACQSNATLPNFFGNDAARNSHASREYRSLYSFKGWLGDGSGPASGLIAANGKLYGTTENGGANGSTSESLNGWGTLYEIDPTGNERVLYSFLGPATGGLPTAGVIFAGRLLYGTTSGAAVT